MPGAALYLKMFTVGAVCCIGGPALMYYVTPSEGELFKRFNPELQKRNLENRERRQQNFDEFVTKLKEYSKSDKPIWEAEKEAQAKERAQFAAQQADQRRADLSDVQRLKDEIRIHSTKPG